MRVQGTGLGNRLWRCLACDRSRVAAETERPRRQSPKPVGVTLPDVAHLLRAIAADIDHGAPGAALLFRADDLKESAGQLEALARQLMGH